MYDTNHAEAVNILDGNDYTSETVVTELNYSPLYLIDYDFTDGPEVENQYRDIDYIPLP